MDKLTTRALQAQVEAAVSGVLHAPTMMFATDALVHLFLKNVDRENSNRIKQEEGALSVARVKAQSENVCIPLLLMLQYFQN